MTKLILTVCKGNIQRSVIAALCIERELRIRDLESSYSVLSRGLQGMPEIPPPKFPNLRMYEEEWRLSSPILDELGLSLPESQRSTPVTADVVREAAVVFAMDDEVLKRLHEIFPEYTSKIGLFGSLTGDDVNVEDPHGKRSANVHRSTITFIDATVRDHFHAILARIA